MTIELQGVRDEALKRWNCNHPPRTGTPCQICQMNLETVLQLVSERHADEIAEDSRVEWSLSSDRWTGGDRVYPSKEQALKRAEGFSSDRIVQLGRRVVFYSRWEAVDPAEL